MPLVSRVTPPSAGILLHAHVRTLVDSGPVAQAVAWADGRITCVGTDEQVLQHAAGDPRFDEAVRLDMGGATVTPGLIDSHVHPAWGAELVRGVDLGAVTTLDGVRDALAAEAARLPDGEWIRAWNIDYTAFSASGIHAHLVDEAVAGRPFIGIFYDLHTALVSTAGIAAHGLTGTEEFADAAHVVVDEAGRPTGELKEPAAYLPVMASLAETDEAVALARLEDVFARFNRLGVTGGAIMEGSAATLDALSALEAAGRLTLRIDTALWHEPEFDDDRIADMITQSARAGRRWRAGAVKIFSDGVIDTGTAWLREPDRCGCSTASFWPEPERLRDVIATYDAAGLRLAVHAVGDRATDFVLDCFEACGPDRASRHRLEHLELLTDADVERLATLQVTASMQPLHMQWRKGDLSDDFATRLGEERAGQSFRCGDVLAAGGRLCLGSDWPVASDDPRYGMAWARLRRRPGDPAAPVFAADQRLSGEQALLGYTRWAAEALGDPDRGRIAVGARADLTGFADDPVHTDPDALIDLPIVLTVVDGEVVHREEAR